MTGVATALSVATTVQAAPVPAAQATETPHVAPGFSTALQWSQTLNDPGSPIALSSPNVANLDGQPPTDEPPFTWKA